MRVMKYTDRGLILPVEVKVAGKYKVRVYRPDGRCRRDTGWFDNLVTDAGLNLMGTGGHMTACQVGSGTTAPAVGNTSLVSYVAGTSTLQTNVIAAQGSAPYYSSRTKTWRFAAGAAAGNLSEVGIGTATTGGTLFSRALITDGAGSPTTITVLADEFLDVTYQIQSVPPTTDSSFNVTDSGPAGTVHAVTLRAAGVTQAGCIQSGGWDPVDSAVALRTSSGVSGVAYDGAIGAITGSPSGTGVNIGGTNDAYVNNSLERTATISLPLDTANFASGIKSITFVFCNGGGGWQAEFNPVIPKTNTDTLSIDVKTSWTRTTAL